MKKTRVQKGITLVALIITIVVLLILAAVAISSIQNDGILHYAQNATDAWNKAEGNEQEILEGYLNYLNGNNGSGENDEDLETVKRYALGVDKEGRAFIGELFDMNTGAALDYAETTDVDESKVITMHGIVEEGFLIKYNNKIYTIIIDDAMNTEDVKFAFEPKGREGQTVKYDSNGDGTDEDWIVLTDRDGLVEIISSTAMGSLTLGSEDTNVTATTDITGDGVVDGNDIAILSYNNAITTINNYCKSLVKEEIRDKVRSVGGTNNNADPYHSTNYDEWGSKITVDVASEDYQCKEDWNKLNFLGIYSVGEEYWLGSRNLYEMDTGSPKYICFDMRYMHENAANWDSVSLFRLKSDGSFLEVGTGESLVKAVRPIIVNPGI